MDQLTAPACNERRRREGGRERKEGKKKDASEMKKWQRRTRQRQIKSYHVGVLRSKLQSQKLVRGSGGS